MSGSNLLCILTGSIACAKACEVISQLVQRGHRVRTVATAAALKFVGPATLEGLTGEPVATDLFEPGAALRHIDLDRWADAMVICPATAHTINRLAAGLADDLAAALALAHDRTKPLLVVPAMNPAMWAHPATQAGVERLQSWGVQVLPVAVGRTACGETGAGRMVAPALIVAAIEGAVARPARRLKVLITSGGTAEPVDAVRVLTNTSTGRTGALLSEHFTRAGHEVVLLRATSAQAPAVLCREEFFQTFGELDRALGRLLGETAFDAVIHAAAVSDFHVEVAGEGGARRATPVTKLSSAAEPVLRLRRNPKLVEGLRARSRNSALAVVAFKLTHSADADEIRAAVGKLFSHASADVVVHNDAARRGAGDDHPADVYRAGGSTGLHCATRSRLAAALEEILLARPVPVSFPP